MSRAHLLAKNLIEDATITYDQTPDPVYTPARLADRSRLSKFQGANATPQHVTFDLGSAQKVDTVVFDRAFVIEGGSSQALIQHSEDNSNWTTALTMTKAGDLASNALPLWKTFTAVTRRYWRLRLTGLTASPVVFNLWLGARIELTFGPMGEFDPWEEESVDDALDGAFGATHNTHRYRRRTIKMDFENLSDSQMGLVDAWWSQAAGAGLNWWLLWDPAAWLATPNQATAPVYLSSAGARRRFPFNRAARYGTIEGREAL